MDVKNVAGYIKYLLLQTEYGLIPYCVRDMILQWYFLVDSSNIPEEKTNTARILLNANPWKQGILQCVGSFVRSIMRENRLPGVTPVTITNTLLFPGKELDPWIEMLQEQILKDPTQRAFYMAQLAEKQQQWAKVLGTILMNDSYDFFVVVMINSSLMNLKC